MQKSEESRRTVNLQFVLDKDVVTKVGADVRSLNAPFGDAVNKANTFLLGIKTLVSIVFINMTSFKRSSCTCVLRYALLRTEAELHRDHLSALTKDRETWLLSDELRDL